MKYFVLSSWYSGKYRSLKFGKPMMIWREPTKYPPRNKLILLFKKTMILTQKIKIVYNMQTFH